MNTTRIEQIKQRLNAVLQPTHLNVIDESHLHIGHPGAQDGRGHFAIEISAQAFAHQPTIACHRMIYAALADMMTTDIHALKIKISAD